MARRILCGVAGHRVQGFLAHLGVGLSYVLINSYLFSLYGTALQPATPAMLSDRYDWVDAILTSAKIEAVVCFGGAAKSTWLGYVSARKPHPEPPHAEALHPTATSASRITVTVPAASRPAR